VAERDATEKKNGKHNRKNKKDRAMHFAERLNHVCGFLSWGGPFFLEIHRRSNRGQNATDPGKIRKRNPTLLPIACESIRFTPTVTKARAKTAPSAV